MLFVSTRDIFNFPLKSLQIHFQRHFLFFQLWDFSTLCSDLAQKLRHWPSLRAFLSSQHLNQLVLASELLAWLVVSISEVPDHPSDTSPSSPCLFCTLLPHKMLFPGKWRASQQAVVKAASGCSGQANNQDESVGFGEGNGNKLGLGLLSCGKNSWENSWVNLSLLVFIRTSCHWFIFSPWDWEKYMGAWQVGNGNSSSAITLCHPQRDVQQESLKWALLHMDREAPQTFLWLRNLFTKAISGQSHYLFLF